MKILVTGGAGFIGSAFVRYVIDDGQHSIVNVDKLTYAGDLQTIETVTNSSDYCFERADICDAETIQQLLAKHEPDAVLHLAAESHVDRSIDSPAVFIQTNIVGTYVMLQASVDYWNGLEGEKKQKFRFLHISTDEVFGELGAEGLFTEETRYDPSSPYSASKAASDHLVAAMGRTYKLPVLVSNCSNNYGPYQFPEKLIPTVIKKALTLQKIPVYGRGENIRDWLYVDDHVKALLCILQNGRLNETYNVGGHNEHTNLEVVHLICSVLDELSPKASGHSYAEQIVFVTDRPGHDFRYAIDASKMQKELGWTPEESFDTGLKRTVMWYLENRAWWQQDNKLSNRLGLGEERV